LVDKHARIARVLVAAKKAAAEIEEILGS